jgi:hypothetical protein
MAPYCMAIVPRPVLVYMDIESPCRGGNDSAKRRVRPSSSGTGVVVLQIIVPCGTKYFFISWYICSMFTASAHGDRR